MINKKVGIIGYGSMGSMLYNGFLTSGIIDKSNLFVSTRSKEKFSGVLCNSNRELAEKSELIFLCAKPMEIKNILLDIKDKLTLEKHIVSIAGSLSIANIEKIFDGKISRLLPTLISEIKEGITLTAHNAKIMPEDKNILNELLSSISEVKEISENEFEIASDLTSCAPGLIAALFKEYVNAASDKSSLKKDEINRIVIKTLYGCARLFYEKSFDFDTTIARVATKGGATEAGVSVLEKLQRKVFDEMFAKTLERQNVRKEKIDEQFIEVRY